MRNAALTLGIIAGLIGMLVGFFSYGYTIAVDEAEAQLGTLPDFLQQVENVWIIRAVGLIAPILAIAGGAMARSQNTLGGAFLIASAIGMFYAFGFGVFTMFPIAMAGLAGILSLAATQPDPH